MPNMIYIVTHGDYSEYSIRGVFTDLELAQEFAAQHNYDTVEHHEADPLETKHPDGYQWRLSFNCEKDEHWLTRLPNEYVDDWNGLWWGDSWSKLTVRAHCIYFARDIDHANKIATDKIAALKAGSTFVHDTDYVPVCLPLPNGRISASASHRDRHDITLKYSGTKFVEINREVTRQEI